MMVRHWDPMCDSSRHGSILPLFVAHLFQVTVTSPIFRRILRATLINVFLVSFTTTNHLHSKKEPKGIQGRYVVKHCATGCCRVFRLCI